MNNTMNESTHYQTQFQSGYNTHIDHIHSSLTTRYMNFKSNTSPDIKDKFYKTNNVNFITSYLESKNKKYYEEDLPYDERLRDKVKDNAKYSTRNKNELMNSSPHDDFYLKTSTPFKLNKPEYKNELYRLNMSKHYH